MLSSQLLLASCPARRYMEASPVVGAEPPPPLLEEDFACAICLETLHKACVNHCGHAMCFWCFHHAMGPLSTSHCPLCRAEFKHFPAICTPLHSFLVRRFPETAAAREEQTKKEEREEWHAESPDLTVPPAAEAAGAAAFACVGCEQLAAPPAVLTCGHVVCARPGGWAGCPKPGCVSGPPKTAMTVAVRCGLLESVLSSEHAEAYREALARGCSAVDPSLQAESAGATATDSDGALVMTLPADPSTLVGTRVELHSLGSEAGRLLNGCTCTIENWDGTAGRFVVVVHEPCGGVVSARRQVRAKPDNLRPLPVPEETYTHFGRGCDGCGMYPVLGRCYCCEDCSEEIGYDLCGQCFDQEIHRRAAPSGRFNQQHRPEHVLAEIPQEDTGLHQLARLHPDLSVEQIMALVQSAAEQEQGGAYEEEGSSGDDSD